MNTSTAAGRNRSEAQGVDNHHQKVGTANMLTVIDDCSGVASTEIHGDEMGLTRGRSPSRRDGWWYFHPAAGGPPLPHTPAVTNLMNHNS